MWKRMSAALVVAVVLVAAALSFSEPAEAAVHCDGQHQCRHKAARHTRRRATARRQRAHARVRRRDERRAVAYVCPMHPDIRERERGTCPKCLMDLVAEPRGKEAGASASGGL